MDPIHGYKLQKIPADPLQIQANFVDSAPRDETIDSNRQSEFRQNLFRKQNTEIRVLNENYFLRDQSIQVPVRYGLMVENNASGMLFHFILIECRSFHTFLNITNVKISFINTNTD